ncbi:hypothetical protein MKW92_046310 [Papaver armeniacum]|nr:hypothetical protein MKW92_046310 [Papaver armeniacum]
MSRLVRHAYKSVAYGLRYHTINGCTIISSPYYLLLIVFTKDEFSKVTDKVKKLTCPKKIEEAIQVLEMGNESGSLLRKLVDDYKHFKLHEEPNLTASNMLRDFVLPCSAGVGLAFVIGEIQYIKKFEGAMQRQVIILFHSWGVEFISA